MGKMSGANILTNRDMLQSSPIFQKVCSIDMEFISNLSYLLDKTFTRSKAEDIEMSCMFYLAGAIKAGRLEPIYPRSMPDELLLSVLCMRAILCSYELLELVKRGKITYNGIINYTTRK